MSCTGSVFWSHDLHIFTQSRDRLSYTEKSISVIIAHPTKKKSLFNPHHTLLLKTHLQDQQDSDTVYTYFL